MKEFKELEVITKEKEIISITCNGCGKQEEGKYSEWLGGIESFKHSFGFGTTKDGEVYEFDLCIECFDRIISEFKYAPEKSRCF